MIEDIKDFIVEMQVKSKKRVNFVQFTQFGKWWYSALSQFKANHFTWHFFIDIIQMMILLQLLWWCNDNEDGNDSNDDSNGDNSNDNDEDNNNDKNNGDDDNDDDNNNNDDGDNDDDDDDAAADDNDEVDDDDDDDDLFSNSLRSTLPSKYFPIKSVSDFVESIWNLSISKTSQFPGKNSKNYFSA